ncbi:hypothetical protein M8745_20695, partial [Lutimaribacter sp. EGI FJ00014]|nr:hypothetical protein [Lutimaribacter sp. EGI FJ00014]
AGNGQYDLVLTTAQARDFVLIGTTEATHPAQVQQRLIYTFGTWLGESRFDRTAGFPWEQAVFGKQPIENISALIYDRAINTEGVEAFISGPTLELDNETRQLTVAAEVQGQDFVAQVQQIIQGPV